MPKTWESDSSFNSDFELGDVLPVVTLSSDRHSEDMVIRKIVTEDYSFKGNRLVVKTLKVEAKNGLLYYACFDEKSNCWSAMGYQTFMDWKESL